MRPAAQPAEGATYACKLTCEEALVDWSRSCLELERLVRAFRPVPGARTLLREEPLKIWRAHCGGGEGVPGTVLTAGAEGLAIACGEGALHVTELQRAGGKRLAAADFLRGVPLQAGEFLGAAR